MLSRALFRVLIICTALQTVMMEHVGPRRIACIVYPEMKPGRLFSTDPMLVDSCLTSCRLKGSEYTGVKYVPNDRLLNCFCANRNDPLKEVTNTKCEYSCPDPEEKSLSCGGEHGYTLYFSGQYDIGRIGCYKDKADRDLPEIHFAGNKATVPYCRDFCKSKDFRYTGVQQPDLCLCGNSFGRYKKMNNLLCNKLCKGNSLTTCGGHWLSEIYHTFDPEPMRIGCFKATKNKEVIDVLPFISSKITVPYCLTYCKSKGFNYMGVRFAYVAFMCACGNSFNRQGKVSGNECNLNCPGDKSQNLTCGGNHRIEIYITGQDIGRRIGCYKNGPIREFAITTSLGDNASVPSCRNLCRSRDFNYTGVQGTFCLCGNSYGGYGKVSDIECSRPCPGNKLTTCGGDRNLMTDGHPRYEIYHTFDVK